MVLAKRQWRCCFSERMKRHDRKHRWLQQAFETWAHVAEAEDPGAFMQIPPKDFTHSPMSLSCLSGIVTGPSLLMIRRYVQEYEHSDESGRDGAGLSTCFTSRTISTRATTDVWR
jgi:hypothetical protein